MQSRLVAYLVLALALGSLSPAVASLTLQEPGQGPAWLDAWFYRLPMLFGALPAPDKPATLAVCVALYAAQYFGVLAVAGFLIARLQRPVGPVAERAFDNAVTAFHDGP